MHYRDTQTAPTGANFVPKNHSAVLINGTTEIEFEDRQGVTFSVNPDKGPTLLPFSVSKQITGSDSVIYLT